MTGLSLLVVLLVPLIVVVVASRERGVLLFGIRLLLMNIIHMYDIITLIYSKSTTVIDLL